ncbi:MAG: T9SS type A sorting domain-containing protein [Bacteroidales bacterium]|nr:T9SS type A sorting domain-containing protein [Bacteroidales bacterium]MCF8402860.1 T9SS type A sorting domain-containing protein [Bacteroidales bacterium]
MKTKNLFLFAMIFSLVTPLVYSQGSWTINQRKPNIMLSDLCMLPDGMHGYTTGNTSGGAGVLSGIYYTTDGGELWDKMNFTNAQTVGLNGIFFTSPETGWVFGDNGKIYKTTDSGVNWAAQSSGTNRSLVRASFNDENEGWIVGGWSDGNAFLVIHTNDGGASWQNLSFGSSAFSCNTVYFSDALNGWIGGATNTLNPYIYATTDGGVSWDMQTIPLSNTGTQISSIHFANAIKGWAVVNSLYETPAGPVLYTEDGGQNWSVQYYTSQSYNQIDVKDEMNIAIVGMSILPGSMERLCVTNDGGQNWTVSIPPIVEYTNGIQYIGDKIWLAANKSIILSTEDLGGTWNWENYSPVFQSMEWISSQLGWAIAGSNVGTDNYSMKTTDGGITWEDSPQAPGGAQVIFYDELTGWMLTEGNTAKVSRTTDGGGTWSLHSIGGTNWIGEMFFISADSGWAFGSNGTLKITTNGGVTWANQNVGSASYVASVWFVNSQEGWAGGGYGGGNGFIAHTMDGGATWEQQSMPYDDHILKFSFLDNKNGWAATTSGTVLITVNGGDTWSAGAYVSTGLAEDFMMINDQSGWMLTFIGGSDQSGEVYRTYDGGQSWTLEWYSDWPKAYLTDVSVQPGNYLWACGNHSAIMQYSNMVKTPEYDVNFSGQFIISPNPVNDFARIYFELDHAARVKLFIFDMHGQAIDIIENNILAKGPHEKTWTALNRNGNKLPSGVYILSAQIDDQYSIQKIVVQ